MSEKEYIERECAYKACEKYFNGVCGYDVSESEVINDFEKIIDSVPNADVSPVRHGRWLYEVHKENVNFRWNVTVKCSECYDNRKEIWGGFFPNVPDCIARGVALQSAKQIKLDNYCPHCGTKMDLKEV